jgi:hypothetical protein
MKKLSTGHDSTLGTYKKLAKRVGPKCVKYFEDKITESPNGENEEVLADEFQMMYLMASMMTHEKS